MVLSQTKTWCSQPVVFRSKNVVFATNFLGCEHLKKQFFVFYTLAQPSKMVANTTYWLISLNWKKNCSLETFIRSLGSKNYHFLTIINFFIILGKKSKNYPYDNSSAPYWTIKKWCRECQNSKQSSVHHVNYWFFFRNFTVKSLPKKESADTQNIL